MRTKFNIDKFHPEFNPEQVNVGDCVRSTEKFRKQHKLRFSGKVEFVLSTQREVMLSITLDNEHLIKIWGRKKLLAIDAKDVRKISVQSESFPFQKGRRRIK